MSRDAGSVSVSRPAAFAKYCRMNSSTTVSGPEGPKYEFLCARFVPPQPLVPRRTSDAELPTQRGNQSFPPIGCHHNLEQRLSCPFRRRSLPVTPSPSARRCSSSRFFCGRASIGGPAKRSGCAWWGRPHKLARRDSLACREQVPCEHLLHLRDHAVTLVARGLLVGERD